MPLLADGLHNLRHALRSWAVLIHWLPTASSMSSLHLLLGLPLSRFPSLGVHSDVIFAHLVFFILATCPAHCPFMHFTFSIISTSHYIGYTCRGSVVKRQNARLSHELPGFEPSWLLFLVALGKPLYRCVLPGLAVKDIVWLNNSTSAI